MAQIAALRYTINSLNSVSQVAPSAHFLANYYYKKTVPILSKVNEMNPQYKREVGNVLFEFIELLVMPSHALKVTGMLMGLPVTEIQKYMVNFDLFL